MMLKKLVTYLMFWKKEDANAPTSTNLKIMHGINRISIYLFIFALTVIIYRFVKGL